MSHTEGQNESALTNLLISEAQYLGKLCDAKNTADISGSLEEILHVQNEIRLSILPLLQQALDGVANTKLGSFEANAKLVSQLNKMRSIYRLAFHLTDDVSKQRVNLRCQNVPRTIAGSFQAVTSDSKHKALYTGNVLPHLQIFDPETEQR